MADETTVLPVKEQEDIKTGEVTADPGYSNLDLTKETIRDIASNTEEPKVEVKVAPVESPEESPYDVPKDNRDAIHRLLK